MDTLDTINGRRSIRRFKPGEVSVDLMGRIIAAGSKAPSGMNRQPWKFVIVEGEKKNQLLEIMQKRSGLLKRLRINTEGYEKTIQSMRQASAVILVLNTGFQPKFSFNPFYRYFRLLDIQSIGAAIQNMLLAAHDFGLGSLWICNVFLVEKKIRAYFKIEEELIAAVALGYADEEPAARPRKNFKDIAEWVN